MVSGPSSDKRRIELRTRAIGYELFAEVEKKVPSILESKWWENQILEWCMQNEEMKTQLLRFVDVFPSLHTPKQLAGHLRQYFPRSNRSFPAFLRIGIDLSSPTPFTRSVLAHEAQAMMTRMARRFIAGANVEEAFDALKQIRDEGMTFTLDLLGEAVLSEAEVDSYVNAYLDTLRTLSTRWSEIESQTDQKDFPNVSLKLSSLYSQFAPIDQVGVKERVKARLRQLFRAAREMKAFIFVDMEQWEYCELTIDIFRELLDETEFHDFSNTGIVLQAYLRESERLLTEMLGWLRNREKPVTIRLVKGAYWDYEIIHAIQMGWPAPVFSSKNETDANFERMTRTLLEHSSIVKAAIGSHNIRSIANAMATAEALGIEPSKLEFQMLYGMGDPIKRAVRKSRYPLRVYTPFGTLIPGMAYLVRRILENTSNESFLRQDFFMGLSPDELLRDPAQNPEPRITASVAGQSVARNRKFANEPVTDFSNAESRRKMGKALESLREELGQTYSMIIGGQKVESTLMEVSINPSNGEEVVGRIAFASADHAEQAVQKAREAFAEWGRTFPAERAGCLFTAAEIMSRRRFELAALEIFEVGKTWSEADADVAEAIDFLRYYGTEMLRLSAHPSTADLPGETNQYFYRPRGVGAIIAPWNFPLAILTGMTSAAIVAGNTVIMKPAPQSPVIAAYLAQVLEEAGVPAGVVNFLPGLGETIGEHLVKSPGVDFIAFTGSREVGERINRLAAAHPGLNGIKRVVAEMGGKNAIIIDETADFDAAVNGVLNSAFGYQGQKCSAASRVIVLDTVHDAFVGRLTQAAKSLRVGPAEDPSTHVGPLIDAEARQKVLRYIEIGKQDARLVYEMDVSCLKGGFFVGPTIFADVAPGSALAQEEIFGPVLALLRCTTFDEALMMANNSSYALTGGLYSRTPDHIVRARREFMVGNLYINRKITGAIVQRQPFGGFRMSGIGSKAGGPDYLLQFLFPQTITENVMRHGFAPLKDV